MTTILHLRTDLWGGLRAGGSLAHATGVIQAFRKFGHAVRSLGPEALPGTCAALWEGPVAAELSRWRRPFAPRAYTRAVVDHLRKRPEPRPQLVYGRHSLMSDASAEASTLLGASHVLEVNNLAEWFSSEFGGWKRLIQWPLIRTIERRVTHAADLCIAISEPVAAALERIGVPRSKIMVQFNGVDPDRFPADLSGADVRRRYPLGDAPVAGFVGTFGDWHGAENLVRAIPAILNSIPGAKFLFVGDGARKEAAESLVRSLGVSAAAVFTGLIPQDDAPPYLAACDVLVSPHSWTRSEPFIGSPTKVFEYMAAGRGIVASRLGQISDVLAQEETALLVPPDDINALAKSVTRLLESPELSRSMGARARATVFEKHTWESNVRQMLSWLQEREKI